MDWMGWVYAENYRGIPIWFWDEEDWLGYWFAWEGEQQGPYDVVQDARDAIDAHLGPADGNGAPALGGLGLLVLLYLIFKEMG